jgi:hypothetical protein
MSRVDVGHARGGAYFTRISVAAWAGTSAQTPVGGSPAFAGSSRTDGQP